MLKCRGVVLVALRLKPGYYYEDNIWDYKTKVYYHPRQMKFWYAKNEWGKALEWYKGMREWQSTNHNEGLKYDGTGPFERELERKGIPVEKYPLPTTTGIRRVREAVLLRRQQLEERAKKLLDEQRKKLRQPQPSEWYNEAGGPLNPHFLAFVQGCYDVNICDLPSAPILSVGEWKKPKLENSST